MGYAAADADAAVPQTWEQWYDSCCYICWETGATMCWPCSSRPATEPEPVTTDIA